VDEIDFYEGRIVAERELGMLDEAKLDKEVEDRLFPQ